MSYTPTEWKTGDTITAEKLNNMESGIAGAGDGNTMVFEFSATADSENPGSYILTTDCTPQDVASAYNSGKVCFARLILGPEKSYIPFGKYGEVFVSAQEDVIVYNAQTLIMTKRRIEGIVPEGTWTYSQETANITRN